MTVCICSSGLVVIVGIVVLLAMAGDSKPSDCQSWNAEDGECLDYLDDYNDRFINYPDEPRQQPAYSGDLDCGHFARQRDAQAAYVAAGGPAFDPHLLDDDRDGYACELLP